MVKIRVTLEVVMSAKPGKRAYARKRSKDR